MDKTTKEISLQSKARIFLVEDETLVLEDLKERLTKHGYEVIGTASSGNEAIEAIRKGCPDLVVMDVRIAGELNGIEVAIVIQSFFEPPIPVIFLTGFSEKTFAYLKVLPDYIYLNKPFRETDLFESVERALKKARDPSKDP